MRWSCLKTHSQRIAHKRKRLPALHWRYQYTNLGMLKDNRNGVDYHFSN